MDFLPLAGEGSGAEQGLSVSQLRKLKQLEEENGRLKKLVAEQALAHEAVKEVLANKGLR